MPQVLNPILDEKSTLLADLLVLRARAALNVLTPNPAPLDGVTISTSPIAARLAAYDASAAGAELALHVGICADLVQAAQDLAAAVVMIDGVEPAAPPMSSSEPPPAPPMP